jgi:hypothetical protein
MVVQFSVEVNWKRQSSLSPGALLPSSKPAILRVFYSGADNIGRRRNANSVGDAILLASSPVSTGCRSAFKAPSAKPTSTRVFWSGPGRWHRPWRRFSG